MKQFPERRLFLKVVMIVQHISFALVDSEAWSRNALLPRRCPERRLSMTTYGQKCDHGRYHR